MNLKKVIFAGGCFWCTEAVFQTVNGVQSVTSGYTGGASPNPTYLEVCNGESGHAEAIAIEYNEDTVSFDDLLLIFFKTHNPTTLNRQGNDTGTQYRSAIFYNSNAQKQQAEVMIKQLNDERVFDKPIVTQLEPATEFFKAEEYHHNYFADNPEKPYCTFVIQPKMNKFAKEFTNKIKPEPLQ